MKKLLAVFAAIALLGTGKAYAALLSYDFVLTLNYVEETDRSTGMPRQVVESNLSGLTYSLGDTLRGKIVYDTDTPRKGFAGCCGEVAYSNYFSKNTLSFVNESNGAVYTSGLTYPPTLIMSNYSTDSGSREGALLALTYAFSPSVAEMAALTVVDRSGKYLGTSVPFALNFPNSESWFSYAWVRQSDNSEMRVGGIVSSLTEAPAEVPEPGTTLLLAIGAGLLSYHKRRKVKRPAQ